MLQKLQDRETGENPSLTKLATTYNHTKDPEIKKELAKKAQPLIKRIALHEISRIKEKNGKYNLNNLICYANGGLLDSIRLYDPSRKTKFETYMTIRVKGAIVDGLRDEDKLYRKQRERLKKIREFENDFWQKHHLDPLYQDYKNFWATKQFNLRSFDYFYYNILRKNTKSIDQKKIYNDYTKDTELSDMLIDKRKKDTEEKIISEELAEIFLDDLSSLSIRDQEVMLDLIKGEKYAEIAEKVGLSASGVFHVKKRCGTRPNSLLRTKKYLGIN